MWDIVSNNWPPVLALCSLVVSVALLLLAKTYANREDVDAVKARVDRLEAKVADQPGHGEIAGLKLEISELRGDLKAIRPELRRLDRLSDLLLENELKEKG